MSLSQLLKTNASSLFAMTTSMVCLLLILQLAIWYPIITEKKSHLDNQIKRRDRALTTWQKTQKQSDIIEIGRFLETPWVKQNAGAKEQGVLTQWQIEGSASITEWQTLLEDIQERLSLGLMSVHWEKQSNGDWYGRLLFDIQSPKANRQYDNWLPTTLRIGRFAAEDWRLLSTMRVGENVSALLEHKDSRHWVRQGSWLPVAGLTVDTVSFGQVTLMAKDGRQMALTVNTSIVEETGEEHD